MTWGLIALGGVESDVERLRAALHTVTEPHDGAWPVFEYVIGVDGGCRLLEKLQMEPDCILGDFDSVGDLSHYLGLWPNAEVLRYPSEKDATDAEIAFEQMRAYREAHGRCPERVVVIGGFGGRADHALSVLFMLPAMEGTTLLGAANEVVYFEGPFRMERVRGQCAGMREYISLIPYAGALEGVTLEGMRYPLCRARIGEGASEGVSNEISESVGYISVESGRGFLVVSREFEDEM